jgi:hypothetical protein
MSKKVTLVRRSDGKELVYDNAFAVHGKNSLYVFRADNDSDEKKEVLAKLNPSDWDFYLEEA